MHDRSLSIYDTSLHLVSSFSCSFSCSSLSLSLRKRATSMTKWSCAFSCQLTRKRKRKRKRKSWQERERLYWADKRKRKLDWLNQVTREKATSFSHSSLSLSCQLFLFPFLSLSLTCSLLPSLSNIYIHTYMHTVANSRSQLTFENFMLHIACTFHST